MFLLNLILFSLLAYSYAFYEESQYVKELNEENFEKDVINGTDIWIIQFFATDNDECSDYSDVYEKAGKALNAYVKVGAVDVNKARLLAYRYNIKKLPTIIYINKDKTSTKHKGGMDEGKLLSVVIDLISRDMNTSLEEKFIDLPFVREFTKSDIDGLIKPSGRWIIAYYSSDSFVTDSFKITFSYLATQLQDIIKFGYYDINKFGTMKEITNTPTIVYYFGRRHNRKALEYNGTMEDVNEVINWTLTKVRIPEVMDLRDENDLRDSCINKKYCVISIIPSSGNCNSDCKKKHKNILQNLAGKYKHYSVAWALIRKSVMSTVEELFEITSETELPIMITVNVQSLRSRSVESFDEAKAEELLEDVFHGSGLPQNRLSGFDNLLNDHYKPWHDEL